VIELRGKHNLAKVFTNNIEETAVGQIIELCNQEFTKDSKIRIMPDTHAGSKLRLAPSQRPPAECAKTNFYAIF
jgi:hypothetical protein